MTRFFLALATVLAALVVTSSAFAAATIVVDKSNAGATNPGDTIWVAGQVTFDATYATGGEALAASTVTTALGTAGYTNASCAAIERLYVSNGEISDAPYFVAWDDENSKLQAFKFTAGSAVTATTGTADTPTAIAIITAETVAIDTVTGALQQIPISIIAADLVGGTSNGKAAHIITAAPDAAQEVRIVPGTKAVTVASSDATAVVVSYAYVSTAGVAATLPTVSGGTASTLAEVGAVDLSSLEVEVYIVCSL